MATRSRQANWGALALALVALAGIAVVATRSGAKIVALPSHARALSLVLEQRFREPGGVSAEAEQLTQARPGSVRTWRVRAVEAREDRLDVIFYIGDRPACVWRVDLSASRVLPDACSLELWEKPRA